MPHDRAERVALTEAAFRIANERMAAWEEAAADEPALYFCECGLLECRQKLSLTVAQYEQVRAEPDHFFVLPGHEIEDLEEVIAEEDGFLVVEKPEAVIALVRGANPRAAADDADAGPGAARADAEDLADGIE